MPDTGQPIDVEAKVETVAEEPLRPSSAPPPPGAPPPRGPPSLEQRAVGCCLGKLAGGLANALAVGVAILALALFAQLSWRHTPRYVPEGDCAAYFAMAQRFAHAEWPAWPEDLWRFADHPWVTAPDGRVMAKYNPGYPLLLALGYRVGGLGGALHVNALLSVLGAAALWLLARHLFGVVGATLTLVVWVCSTVAFPFSNYPLTHATDTGLLCVAALCAWRHGRHGGRLNALGFGLAAGLLPVVRTTNVLLWPALGVAWLMGTHAAMVAANVQGAHASLARIGWTTLRGLLGGKARGKQPPAWRRRGAVLGTLAFVLPLLAYAAYNTHAFGAPWRTGYALSGEQDAFSLAYLPHQVQTVLNFRQGLLPDAFWGLALVGLLAHRWRRGVLALVAWWVLPTCLVFWMYYYTSEATPYLRFFHPVVPALALGAGLLALPLARRPWWRLVAVVAGLILLALTPPPRLRQALAAWRHPAEPIAYGQRPVGALFLSRGRSPDHAAAPRLVAAWRAANGAAPLTVYAAEQTLWTLTAADEHVVGVNLGNFLPPEHGWVGEGLSNRPRQDPRRAAAVKAVYAGERPAWRAAFQDDVHRRLARGDAVWLLLPRHGDWADWVADWPAVTLTELPLPPDVTALRPGFRACRVTLAPPPAP